MAARGPGRLRPGELPVLGVFRTYTFPNHLPCGWLSVSIYQTRRAKADRVRRNDPTRRTGRRVASARTRDSGCGGPDWGPDRGEEPRSKARGCIRGWTEAWRTSEVRRSVKFERGFARWLGRQLEFRARMLGKSRDSEPRAGARCVEVGGKEHGRCQPTSHLSSVSDPAGILSASSSASMGTEPVWSNEHWGTGVWSGRSLAECRPRRWYGPPPSGPVRRMPSRTGWASRCSDGSSAGFSAGFSVGASGGAGTCGLVWKGDRVGSERQLEPGLHESGLWGRSPPGLGLRAKQAWSRQPPPHSSVWETNRCSREPQRAKRQKGRRSGATVQCVHPSAV